MLSALRLYPHMRPIPAPRGSLPDRGLVGGDGLEPPTLSV